MKKLIALAVLTLVTASSAFAQGTLNFANFFGSVREQVFNVDGVTPLEGAQFEAELWYDTGSGLTLLDGSQTPFGEGDFARGYFFGGTQEIPGTTAGGSVMVQVHAYDTGNPSIEGFSDVFEVSPLGGDALPPANMVNFGSFNLVPEPSIFALAILGAGALFLRRRRNK